MITVLEFEISSGILSHEKLPCVGSCILKELPLSEYGKKVIGISGRGPVWLYAYLTHLLHPYAGVAVYDPRVGGYIVVSRHATDVPAEGSVIPSSEVEETIRVML